MKKILGLVLISCLAILLVGCGNKKINWEEIELGDKVPKPETLTGKITTNRSDLTIIDIEKISKKEYKSYVEKCRETGYTNDLEYESWDLVYGAFDNDGYSIRISYLETSNKMSITLKTPEKNEMKEIEWPTNSLVYMLPVPNSTLGKISYNNNKKFIIHIGNTTFDDYKEYVKDCENLGFTIDYSKSDKSFRAKNSEGYEVHITYLGANVVEISLNAPKDNNSSSNENDESDKKNDNTSGISKDFKKAMDNYEEFIDEYISFMKRYNNSNRTDIQLIKDYTEYLKKYSEMLSSFEKWENENLNSEEAKYYLEVQTRVSKKLIDAAIQ